MSDKRNFPFEEELWDAEAALQERTQKREMLHQSVVNHCERVKTKPTAHRSGKTQSTVRQQPPRSSRRKKRNIKGWLILSVIALVLLAILIGLVTLIVSFFSADEENAVTTTAPTMQTEPISTEPDEATLLLERAERLAASYDYDAAIAALQEYGEDWQKQTDLAAASERYEQLKGELVRWEDTTTIPHLSFRALIVDTDRAFDGDANEATYNQTMVSVEEFRAILQELYDGGFVLINMHDMVKNVATDEGATDYEQGDIYLPEGKKPIVISQEDTNYYRYRVDGPDEDRSPDAQGDGFACQLLLDENGQLTCKYIESDGNVLYGAYDLVPIVEEFVAAHPDFSYRGAKGMITVTGDEGVFGFLTHPDWEETLGEDAYMQQIRQAQDVVEVLKENGWEIASMGYSRIAYSDSKVSAIKEDLRRWANEVEPIVGKTDIFVYPYGSDIGGVNYYKGEKFNVLYDAGYRFFCGMDSSQYWVQLRSNYMRQARRVIDGYRMEYGSDYLKDLFNADLIIDKKRPRPVPPL